VCAQVSTEEAVASSPATKKTIVVSGGLPAGQQFVVTQSSKGQTIIQPAGAAGAGQQQYIVTGTCAILI